MVALAKDIAVALVRWLRRIDSVTPLGGGWNSRTWLVAAADERYVAKLVDHLDAQGLDASRIERGIDRGPGPPNANQEGLAAAYDGMTAGSGS